MKKITLFFTVLLGLGLTSLQAQSCSKSASACSKKSASVATAGHCSGSADAAAKLASLDETIESRTCEKSGNVSYVRRETDVKTGQVVFTSLEYNSDLGKFVNQSPSNSKACCSAGKATSCCAGKMKVTEAAAENNADAKPVKLQKGS
jgi:hypothetical protein